MPIVFRITFIVIVYSLNPSFAMDFPVLDIKDLSNSKDQYFSGGYQVGLHQLDVNHGYDLSSIGEGINMNYGRIIMPIISVEGAFNVWSVDTDDEDPLEHALLHDFHFYGVSLGVNGIFHLPGNQGPYLKVGRHCWSASVEDIINLWDGQGCSNLTGVGAYFGKSGSGFMLEMSYIRFKEVKSTFLTLGYRQ